MTVRLLNGMIADTPINLTDRIRVSVPDLKTTDRTVYGPYPFDPIVSGGGGTRLPQTGDKAVVGVDDASAVGWIICWHRDDTTAPPYPS